MLEAAPASVLTVTGPVLIFGGCYSNLQATTALLEAAKRHGIAFSRVICTGDAIAYGADPQACIDLLRDHDIATVMGNCEEQVAADAADCGCGFAPDSACDRLSSLWFRHARDGLNDEAKHWMARLPCRIDLVVGDRRLAVVHGAPSRINRFIFASDPDDLFEEEIDIAGCDGVVAGHCGLAFTRVIGNKIWHNAGAIGLPANDGTPRGWYSILTPQGDGFSFSQHSLSYDYKTAAAAMRRANLPEDYAVALETGIWPNLDILPLVERARTATPQPAPPPAPDAVVALERLETLWINTGTLCNLACQGCYIESSPRNDRLAYFPLAEFNRLLDEAGAIESLFEIAFTGGEPFMNPDILAMLEGALQRGYRTLVLSNAMLPMQHHFRALEALHAKYGGQLAVRVSLDHFTPAGHGALRGPRAWQPALAGIRDLFAAGFAPSIAARFDPKIEDEAITRAGFAALFAAQKFDIDAYNPDHLVLFAEMDRPVTVPGVSAAAWGALRPRGVDAMCRTSRMAVQRKGADRASIVACTLLPYESRFELGNTLAEAGCSVTLDHPHCAQFCVFGSSSCMSAR